VRVKKRHVFGPGCRYEREEELMMLPCSHMFHKVDRCRLCLSN